MTANTTSLHPTDYAQSHPGVVYHFDNRDCGEGCGVVLASEWQIPGSDSQVISADTWVHVAVALKGCTLRNPPTDRPRRWAFAPSGRLGRAMGSVPVDTTCDLAALVGHDCRDHADQCW